MTYWKAIFLHLIEIVIVDNRCFRNISNMRDTVSSGHPNTAKSIFDEIRGVWIADESLSRVFSTEKKTKV